jgi:uncharacterized RDD family membrane protein YckC
MGRSALGRVEAVNSGPQPPIALPEDAGETSMGLPEGWYQVAGDPSGTRRFWDGEQFIGNPEAVTVSSRRSGFVRTDSTARLRMANWFTRGLALVIDLAAPVVIITGIASALGATHPGSDLEAWRDATGIIAAIGAFWLVNRVVMLGLAGRSLGLVLVGARVVRERDRHRSPGIVAALLRSLVMFPTLPLSVLMFFFNKRRAVHDLVAGTCVVYA